jgi:hypothetical protein
MLQAKDAEKILKYILCSENVSDNRALYGTMWKNMVETNSPQFTVLNGERNLPAG